MAGNKALITDVLKKRMGFDGIVLGDWNAHGQVPGCTNEDCAAAYNAGLDMLEAPDSWKGLYRNTLAEVKSGAIPMSRVDDAVTRILRVKMRLGMFNAGLPSQNPLARSSAQVIGSAAHRAVARRAVRESLVLLKNNHGLLPLDPHKRILVAGDGADLLDGGPAALPQLGGRMHVEIVELGEIHRRPSGAVNLVVRARYSEPTTPRRRGPRSPWPSTTTFWLRSPSATSRSSSASTRTSPRMP